MFAGVSSPATRTGFFARCRSVAALTAATLLTAASLAACSGSASDEATPTVTTPKPVVTTIPSPTPSPTPTGEPFELEDIPVPPEPMIPQEMLQYNQAGAQAFVMYALNEFYWMYATNDASMWNSLYDVGCAYCADHADQQENTRLRITNLKLRFTGWEFYQPESHSTQWLVGVHYKATAHHRWDLASKRVYDIPAIDGSESLYFHVGYDEIGWGIYDILTARPVEYFGELKNA